MLGVFNGIYKDNKISVDVVQADPAVYELDENLIWFDVSVSVENQTDITLSAFRFYLADSDKKIINPASVVDSSHFDKGMGVVVGFEFKPDFFYSVPVFGVYCDTHKRLELIEMTC